MQEDKFAWWGGNWDDRASSLRIYSVPADSFVVFDKESISSRVDDTRFKDSDFKIYEEKCANLGKTWRKK